MDSKKKPRRTTASQSKNKPPARKTGRNSSRKKKYSSFQTNIIILAVIFGVCVMLLAGRFLFVLPEVPQDTAGSGRVERPAEQTVPEVPQETDGVGTDRDSGPAEGTSRQPQPDTPAPQPDTPVLPPAAVRTPPVEKPVPAEPAGTLVFVFDDAGYNLNQLQPFLDLPFPVTIAVLPGLRYSAEAARRIRAAGKDCILHQPMQAVNRSQNPGPGAILPGMEPDEIRAIVRANIDEIAPVTGMNNHEGSLITSDTTAMNAVLDVVAEQGLYFLDSRTTAETVVPSVARARNMRIWERAVFLDNSQDRNTIMDAVYSGMKIAERRGSAIMIGHIWSNELAQILTEMYPDMVSQGFSLSTIAKIAASAEGDE